MPRAQPSNQQRPMDPGYRMCVMHVWRLSARPDFGGHSDNPSDRDSAESIDLESWDDTFEDDDENHYCKFTSGRPIPRVDNFMENVVARYTDKEFQENFQTITNLFGVGKATAWRTVLKVAIAWSQYRWLVVYKLQKSEDVKTILPMLFLWEIEKCGMHYLNINVKGSYFQGLIL
ncbi:hypothetical protein PV326_007134 [Microctonus aethiopoides]|nr:hypothetical protein PV326_007134 [Microctonus aethiopoides]